MKDAKTRYLTAGDRALTIEFGNEISKVISRKVRSMKVAIESRGISGIIELVPTYCSLTVHYDPLTISYDDLIDTLKTLENQLDEISLPEPRVTEIPTLYGGKYGENIEYVANYNRITVEDVAKIHASKEYLIYMLGFTPGFCYLDQVDEKIVTPRLATPRIKVPAGSVGIGGKQTGIYPTEGPAGWRIIGRTPLKLFDPFRKKPVLLEVGDYVKFIPIDEDEYKKIEEAVNNGTYVYTVYPKKGVEDCNGRNENN
jgi:KipI family sensor histidine kinase inhibitor